MALIHVPVSDELHVRCRDRMKALTRSGRRTTWESLVRELCEAWLSGAGFGPDTLPKDEPEKPKPEPAEKKHLAGCGVGARGCVEGCPFYDPRFDG